MNDIEIIKSLAGTCFGLIVTAVTFFVKGKSNGKNKKAALNNLKIASVLLPWIKEAEQFLNYSGVEKKEYVLVKASRYALENKINFNEEEITKKIEEYVDFTKQVNCKETKEPNQVIKSWLER